MYEEAQVPEKQRWALILEIQKAKSLIYDPINQSLVMAGSYKIKHKRFRYPR